MNAVFNINKFLTFGEELVTLTMTGTAVFIAALPLPSPLDATKDERVRSLSIESIARAKAKLKEFLSAEKKRKKKRKKEEKSRLKKELKKERERESERETDKDKETEKEHRKIPENDTESVKERKNKKSEEDLKKNTENDKESVKERKKEKNDDEPEKERKAYREKDKESVQERKKEKNEDENEKDRSKGKEKDDAASIKMKKLEPFVFREDSPSVRKTLSRKTAEVEKSDLSDRDSKWSAKLPDLELTSSTSDSGETFGIPLDKSDMIDVDKENDTDVNGALAFEAKFPYLPVTTKNYITYGKFINCQRLVKWADLLDSSVKIQQSILAFFDALDKKLNLYGNGQLSDINVSIDIPQRGFFQINFSSSVLTTKPKQGAEPCAENVVITSADFMSLSDTPKLLGYTCVHRIKESFDLREQTGIGGFVQTLMLEVFFFCFLLLFFPHKLFEYIFYLLP
jgi:chemotaxis protein histidine kinase CheA